MIGLLYRALPGPRGFKTALFVMVALAVLAYLFGWGFEALSPVLPSFDAPLDSEVVQAP